MNTQSSKSNRSIGIRFAVLLLPLFASVIFISAAILYPGQLHTALTALDDATPLAIPEFTVSVDHNGAEPFSDAVLDELASIGTLVPSVRYDTETADGTRIRLLALDLQSSAPAFVLTDGRMPQNETECVIVALDTSASTSSAWGMEIGSAIRPCGPNGDVLTDPASLQPCTLTVVGIAENTQSALAPITENEVQLLVYTQTNACWTTHDAHACLYLTDCTTNDPTAVMTLCQQMEDAQIAHRTAYAEEQLSAALAVGEAAENAVIAHEITVQAIENRLATAELRTAEAETNMMNAVAQLQADRQAFVSDMEYNEYYALRQVDLIPRRDRAEEGFAKQEEEIAHMNDVLQAAYRDRDAIRVELNHANSILDELKADAEHAKTAVETLQRLAEQASDTQTWNISSRAQDAAHTALTSHAEDIRKTSAWIGGIAAVLFLLASITVYAVSSSAVCSIPHFMMRAVLVAVGGVLLGGCLLTPMLCTYAFPALDSSLRFSVFSAETLLSGIGILLAAAVLSAGAAWIGTRLQKKHAVRSHT